MTYEVKFDQHFGYIHAVATGDNTADSVLGYMNDIKNECERTDCYRVLVEENLTGPRLDEMQIFSLIDKGSSDALGFFEVLAYVDQQQHFEVVKFAETVAVNRGIPVAAFNSIEEAEYWLKHREAEKDAQDIFAGNVDS